jgi:hypothetical protein
MKLIYILAILLFLPLISIGQIPKDHFLDADETGENGYKIKPFIQKEKGIYHYNVLSELPFENNCDGYIHKENELNCSEMTLGILVGQQIKENTRYQGVSNIYLTVTERGEIIDIDIKSYPPSEQIDRILTKAVNKVSFKPAKYKRKTVKSRLWTKIDFKKRN